MDVIIIQEEDQIMAENSHNILTISNRDIIHNNKSIKKNKFIR